MSDGPHIQPGRTVCDAASWCLFRPHGPPSWVSAWRPESSTFQPSWRRPHVSIASHSNVRLVAALLGYRCGCVNRRVSLRKSPHWQVPCGSKVFTALRSTRRATPCGTAGWPAIGPAFPSVPTICSAAGRIVWYDLFFSALAENRPLSRVRAWTMARTYPSPDADTKLATCASGRFS